MRRRSPSTARENILFECGIHEEHRHKIDEGAPDYNTRYKNVYKRPCQIRQGEQGVPETDTPKHPTETALCETVEQWNEKS